jgi:hypothetical protein
MAVASVQITLDVAQALTALGALVASLLALVAAAHSKETSRKLHETELTRERRDIQSKTQ